MKKISVIAVVLGSCLAVTAFGNEKAFQKIAEQAPVANGSADIERYDVRVSKQVLVETGLAELKREYWEGCGPWKTIKTRRTGIARIAALEDMSGGGVGAEILNKLYAANEIVAIVGAESNHKVECSLYWYNIYGADGTVLKLRYNTGD